MALGHAGEAKRGEVKIRPATEADIEAIHAVHVASMRHLQQTDPQKTASAQNGVHAYIDSRKAAHVAEEMTQQRFIVADDHDEVCGFAALKMPKQEVSMVFVNPAHQRRGIGRALLAELESVAHAQGLDEVQLQATGTAIEFYLKVGYQSDPPVEPGAEWALMKKKLA